MATRTVDGFSTLLSQTISEALLHVKTEGVPVALPTRHPGNKLFSTSGEDDGHAVDKINGTR